MEEYELIKSMAAFFPRSKLQVNGLFEADAEILRIGGDLWGLTMDDFSPAEDMFTSDDPVRLGANLAVATLSDLFAAGAEPKFFMHSVSLPANVRKEFVSGMMEGISGVLGRLDCAMCGGDAGTADPWRFCGFGMGLISSGRHISRRLPSEPQSLWVTGRLGDANLAALLNAPTPCFELRDCEAGLIRRYASGCIDTSGGFFDALWMLHKQNPGLRFDIKMKDVPISAGVESAAVKKGFPVEAALLGGAGEYELLFAVPESKVSSFQAGLALSGEAVCIGSIYEDGKGGVHLYRRDGRGISMTDAPPCPRAAGNAEVHVREVMEMAHHLFGAGARQ